MLSRNSLNKFISRSLCLFIIFNLSGCAEKHIKPFNFFSKKFENKSNKELNVSTSSNINVSSPKVIYSGKNLINIVNKDGFYIVKSNGIISMDKSNMKKKWEYNSPSGLGNEALSIIKDKIYIINGPDLAVIEASTGSIINSTILPDVAFSDPIILKGKIYICTVKNNIYVLDEKNLNQVGRYEADQLQLFSGKPNEILLINNILVIVDSIGNIKLISPENLSEIKRYPSKSSIDLNMLTVFGSNIESLTQKYKEEGRNKLKTYIYNNREGFKVLDESGNLVMTKNMPDLVSAISTDYGIFAINYANQIAGFDFDLNPSWILKIPTKIDPESYSNIVEYKGNLIFCSKDSLYVVNAKTGKISKKYSTKTRTKNIILINDELFGVTHREIWKSKITDL